MSPRWQLKFKLWWYFYDHNVFCIFNSSIESICACWTHIYISIFLIFYIFYPKIWNLSVKAAGACSKPCLLHSRLDRSRHLIFIEADVKVYKLTNWTVAMTPSKFEGKKLYCTKNMTETIKIYQLRISCADNSNCSFTPGSYDQKLEPLGTEPQERHTVIIYYLIKLYVLLKKKYRCSDWDKLNLKKIANEITIETKGLRW